MYGGKPTSLGSSVFLFRSTILNTNRIVISTEETSKLHCATRQAADTTKNERKLITNSINIEQNKTISIDISDRITDRSRIRIGALFG